MLNALRMGNSNTDIVAHFKKLSRPVVYSDGIEATELYGSSHDVISYHFAHRIASVSQPELKLKELT